MAVIIGIEKWVHFYGQDGRELGAYTVRGTFPGEMEETKKLLAAENGINPDTITVKLTEKKETVK